MSDTSDAGDGPEGYVRIELMAEQESTDDTLEEDKAMVAAEVRRALEIVRECVSDGHAHADIAILVRSGSQARMVSGHFEARGVEVFSAEGLLLGGDAVVTLVVDLLRHTHAADEAAGVRAVQRMTALDILPNDDRCARDPLRMLLEWTNTHARPGLHRPLGDQLVATIGALGLSPATDAYLMFLLDEAHAFTVQYGDDVGGFLDHWDRRGRERAVQRPAGDRAVQVFTVHKAKGLQFPVVIVPFTRMSGAQRDRDPLWIDPGNMAPGLPTTLVRTTGAMSDAGVPEVEEEKHLRLLDDLDLLYVAFTRPRERLHAFVREGGGDPFLQRLAAFVRAEGEGGVFTAGSRRKIEQRVQGPATEVMKAITGEGRYRPAIRHDAPENWDPIDPDPYRAHGERIHALMAEVDAAADLPAVLARAVERGEFHREEAASLEASLGAVLRLPDVAPLFAQGALAGNEVTMIDVDGRVLRPDRIVEKDGTWHVLDIKTGRPVQHHHEQVRRYMQVLGRITGASVSGSLLYLPTGQLTRVA